MDRRYLRYPTLQMSRKRRYNQRNFSNYGKTFIFCLTSPAEFVIIEGEGEKMNEPNKKVISGVVTEAYPHDERHLIVIVRGSLPKSYFYFFVQRGTLITMGDQARLNFITKKFYIIQDYFGYPFKKFKMELDPWPDKLLATVMADSPIFGDPK